jgi:hypothetical protein
MIEPNPSNTAKSVRFSLRELCIVALLVCITAGFFSWARIEPGAIILVAVAAFATIAFTIYALTHWSLLPIIAWTAAIFVVGFCLGPFPRFGAHEAARRVQCSNHLRQIGLALHNYHDFYGSLPPAFVADSHGKPIHSWRVLILPFMENKQSTTNIGSTSPGTARTIPNCMARSCTPLPAPRDPVGRQEPTRAMSSWAVQGQHGPVTNQ